MPPAMASSHLERSLYVVAPKFEKDSSSHTITFKPGHGWAAEFWWVTLTWIDHDKLRVATCWTCSSCHTSIKFQSMRIIPRSNFLQVAATVMLESKVVYVNGYDGYSAQATVSIDSVLENDHYNFSIVFSTEPDLLRSYFTPAAVTSPAPIPAPNLTLRPVSKEKELIALLLKDPGSVDVCFIFTADKMCSNTGLWAHCFLLSQHESLARLIQEAKTLHSLGAIELAKEIADGDVDVGSDTETISTFSANSLDTAAGPTTKTSPIDTISRVPLVIKVDAVSLATFCVMLYYIYTGEVDRIVDNIRFVLSETNKVSLVWRDSAGKVKDSVNWRPLDQDSPWRLKDVTWKELKDAAVHFGLTGLQVIAEQGLQSDK